MKANIVIIEKLIWSWIKILAEIIPRFPGGPGGNSSPAKELMDDFGQFIALSEHLQMRLSGCPSDPWCQFYWNLDFKMFLDQLLRRSYYCLSHLAAFLGSN